MWKKQMWGFPSQYNPCGFQVSSAFCLKSKDLIGTKKSRYLRITKTPFQKIKQNEEKGTRMCVCVCMCVWVCVWAHIASTIIHTCSSACSC